MKYLVLLVLALLNTNIANAGIYKCKQQDDSIEYSNKPCPQDTKKENIKNIRGINASVNKLNKKVPFVEVEKVSEVIKHIRLDGFGTYSLKGLKNKFQAGEKINKKVNLLKHKHWGGNFYEIQTSNKNISIHYVATGMNYNIYENPEKQRLDNNNEYDQLESFIDITMDEVNNYAASIGLKRKQIHHGSNGQPLGSSDLTWKWKREGFNCELSVSIYRWYTPHELYYVCSYTAPG